MKRKEETDKKVSGRKSTVLEYEKRIPDLLHMMIVQHLSFNEFIQKAGAKYEVSQRIAADWWTDIRNRLKERYVQESEVIINEQIARYFSLYEIALERGNTRVVREILADLNKLYGLEKPAKLDITSGDEPIKINIVFNKD